MEHTYRDAWSARVRRGPRRHRRGGIGPNELVFVLALEPLHG